MVGRVNHQVQGQGGDINIGVWGVRNNMKYSLCMHVNCQLCVYMVVNLVYL